MLCIYKLAKCLSNFLCCLKYHLFFHFIEEIIIFFSDVWGKFLEFEGTCGDLASLVKVENRKLEAYREVSVHLI